MSAGAILLLEDEALFIVNNAVKEIVDKVRTAIHVLVNRKQEA
jgi:hypothetical protein